MSAPPRWSYDRPTTALLHDDAIVGQIHLADLGAEVVAVLNGYAVLADSFAQSLTAQLLAAGLAAEGMASRDEMESALATMVNEAHRMKYVLDTFRALVASRKVQQQVGAL